VGYLGAYYGIWFCTDLLFGGWAIVGLVGFS